MLSLNQTFDDTRAVKVLVVPIGNNSLFDSHFQVVSRLREVPFYELNRPRNAASGVMPFKYLDWSHGDVLFDYLRYDRVPNGPGDLDNFQSSRRVLMIMGLINYPELGEVADKIEEELEYFARRHPNVILMRLFVFNFTFDVVDGTARQPPKGLRSDPNSLVIFPPEGNCEGGSMVDVHLHEVMCHASVQVITSLEKQMELCEDARARNDLPSGLALSTIHDELEEHNLNLHVGKDSVTVRGLKKLFRRKPSGRIRKWMGDLSLQVCSPLDAIEHYAAAVAECRSLGDNLWLAGALDGYAASVLLLLQHEFNLEECIGRDFKQIAAVSTVTGEPLSEQERGLRLAEERANEAIGIYSRNIVFCSLQVEGTLRLARMFETSPDPIGKEEKVMTYMLRAMEVQGLNTQQQIEVTLEGALICYRLGMRRKYALYLYVAALMSAENDNYAVAHALMHYACHEYGISTGADDLTPLQLTTLVDGYTHDCRPGGSVQDLPHTRLSGVFKVSSRPLTDVASTKEAADDADAVVVRDASASWTSIRAALFTNGVLMAKEHGDHTSSSRFMSALLRVVAEIEAQHHAEKHKWDKVQFSRYLGGTFEKLLDWITTSYRQLLLQSEHAGMFSSVHANKTVALGNTDDSMTRSGMSATSKLGTAIDSVAGIYSSPSSLQRADSMSVTSDSSIVNKLDLVLSRKSSYGAFNVNDFNTRVQRSESEQQQRTSFSPRFTSTPPSSSNASIGSEKITLPSPRATPAKGLARTRSMAAPSSSEAIAMAANGFLGATGVAGSSAGSSRHSARLQSTDMSGVASNVRPDIARSNSGGSLAAMLAAEMIPTTPAGLPRPPPLVPTAGRLVLNSTASYDSTPLTLATPIAATVDSQPMPLNRSDVNGSVAFHDIVSAATKGNYRMGAQVPTLPTNLLELLQSARLRTVHGVVIGVEGQASARAAEAVAAESVSNKAAAGANLHTRFADDFDRAEPSPRRLMQQASLNQALAVENNDTMLQMSHGAQSFSERLLRSFTELNVEDLLVPPEKPAQQPSSNALTSFAHMGASNATAPPACIGGIDLLQAGDMIKALLVLMSEQSVPLQQQQDSLLLFTALCGKIPPCTTVQLPVDLVSFRPLMLTGADRPVPIADPPAVTLAKRNIELLRQYTKAKLSTDPEGTGALEPGNSALLPDEVKASALFYDPFAARRAKNSVIVKHELCWTVGRTTVICAVFCNRLAVPVQLDNVLPLLEGAQHTVYNRSLLIPANAQNYEVELSVRPLEVGQLRVVGLKLFLFNAMQVVDVDETGSAVSVSMKGVAVIHQPLLGHKTGAPAVEKSTVAHIVAAHTNLIRVVQDCPTFQLHLSWTSLDKAMSSGDDARATDLATAAAHRIDRNGSDYSICDLKSRTRIPEVLDCQRVAVDLLPGECRRESMWLTATRPSQLSGVTQKPGLTLFSRSVAANGSNDNALQIAEETVRDMRITIKQYDVVDPSAAIVSNLSSKNRSGKGKPAAITWTALDFSKTLAAATSTDAAATQPPSSTGGPQCCWLVPDDTCKGFRMNLCDGQLLASPHKQQLAEHFVTSADFDVDQNSVQDQLQTVLQNLEANSGSLLSNRSDAPKNIVVDIEIVPDTADGAFECIEALKALQPPASAAEGESVSNEVFAQYASQCEAVLQRWPLAQLDSTDFTVYTRRIIFCIQVSPCTGATLQNAASVDDLSLSASILGGLQRTLLFSQRCAIETAWTRISQHIAASQKDGFVSSEAEGATNGAKGTVGARALVAFACSIVGVRRLLDSVSVVFTISNASKHDVLVGSSMSTLRTAVTQRTLPAAVADQWTVCLDFEGLSTGASFVVHVPARGSINVVVRYDAVHSLRQQLQLAPSANAASAAGATASESLLLHWALFDAVRGLTSHQPATTTSNNSAEDWRRHGVRSGLLLLDPSLAQKRDIGVSNACPAAAARGQAVDISSTSALVAPAVSHGVFSGGRPPLQCSLLVASLSAAMTPTMFDSKQVLQTESRQNVDIIVQVSIPAPLLDVLRVHGGVDGVVVEVTLAVLNLDTETTSDCFAGGSGSIVVEEQLLAAMTSRALPHSSKDFITSGKVVSTHPLRRAIEPSSNSNGAVLLHRQRVCFTHAGSFALVPLLRVRDTARVVDDDALYAPLARVLQLDFAAADCCNSYGGGYSYGGWWTTAQDFRAVVS